MAEQSAPSAWSRVTQLFLAAAVSALAAVIGVVGQGFRADIAAIHTSDMEHARAQSAHDIDVAERLGRLESTARTNVERLDRLESRVDNAVARIAPRPQ